MTNLRGRFISEGVSIKFLLTWWNIDLFSKKLGKALVDFLGSLLDEELRHF